MHQQAQQEYKNSSNIHFSTQCDHVVQRGETFFYIYHMYSNANSALLMRKELKKFSTKQNTGIGQEHYDILGLNNILYSWRWLHIQPIWNNKPSVYCLFESDINFKSNLFDLWNKIMGFRI